MIVDGKTLKEIVFDNRMGWYMHSVDLRGIESKNINVEFCVYSDRPKEGKWRRRFLFDAYVV